MLHIEKTMKVLIVCEKFAPENTVGAIRMSKVAKYLKLDHNCNITVLLRDRQAYDLLGDAQFVDHFIFASESKIGKALIRAYKKYSSSAKYDERNRKEHTDYITKKHKKHVGTVVKEYAKSLLSTAYSEYTPRSYCRQALKALRKDNNGIIHYDVVISSFGPAASHYIGRKIKEIDPAVFWIADYRDPIAVGEATKGLLHYWGLSFAKRITGKANAFTVASEGFIKCLNLKELTNVHVINNGYDRDDYKGIVGIKQVPHERMRLVYTGTLFAGSRDISAVLLALKDLIDEGKINKDKIEIIYAGQHKNEFLYQLKRADVDIHVDAYDIIPKKDALILQNSADLLLIAAWNTEDYQGSLPLKIYEYLYVGKPVLCTVSGTVGDSELKRLIEKCNAGFCYEAANHSIDYEMLKTELLKYYHEFEENGFVKGYPEEINKEAIAAYDYKQIAAQFYNLMGV